MCCGAFLFPNFLEQSYFSCPSLVIVIKNLGTQENANGTATIPYMLDRMSLRGRKKSTRGSKTVTSSRRGRRSFNQTTETSELTQPQPPVTMEVTEKPDANMCLKVFYLSLIKICHKLQNTCFSIHSA